MKRPGRNPKYPLNKSFWMIEWRESLTHSVSVPSTVEPMPQLANPGIRRGKTPFSSCKKDQLLIAPRATEVWQLLSKLQKSTSSTKGQMKGCIRHVILVFNSKTPISHWASAAQKVSNRYTADSTFHLTWTSQSRSCPWRLYPKRCHIGTPSSHWSPQGTGQDLQSAKTSKTSQTQFIIPRDGQ